MTFHRPPSKLVQFCLSGHGLALTSVLLLTICFCSPHAHAQTVIDYNISSIQSTTGSLISTGQECVNAALWFEWWVNTTKGANLGIFFAANEILQYDLLLINGDEFK
jgi:hypothetical protein